MATCRCKILQIVAQSHRHLTSGCAEIKHVKCWNCDHLLDCLLEKFFCKSCSKIQPPVKCTNYFQYFGFPIRFDIDATQLSMKHKNLQRLIHPDKFSRTSEVTKHTEFLTTVLVHVLILVLIYVLMVHAHVMILFMYWH